MAGVEQNLRALAAHPSGLAISPTRHRTVSGGTLSSPLFYSRRQNFTEECSWTAQSFH